MDQTVYTWPDLCFENHWMGKWPPCPPALPDWWWFDHPNASHKKSFSSTNNAQIANTQDSLIQKLCANYIRTCRYFGLHGRNSGQINSIRSSNLERRWAVTNLDSILKFTLFNVIYFLKIINLKFVFRESMQLFYSLIHSK